MAVLHLPGPGRSFGDDLDHRCHVEAGLHAEIDPLRQALDEPRYADLIDHLGELARTWSSQEPAHAGIMGDQRGHLGEFLLLAAAHHRKHAILGARLAA